MTYRLGNECESTLGRARAEDAGRHRSAVRRMSPLLCMGYRMMTNFFVL